MPDPDPIAQSDIEHARGLFLEFIWQDEDVVQLAVHLNYEGFCGHSHIYEKLNDLGNFADLLNRFQPKEGGLVQYAGFGDGSKSLSLRVYPLGRSLHVVTHIVLTTDAGACHSPEAVWRIELEMRTDPASLDRFANELRSISTTFSGSAFLCGR